MGDYIEIQTADGPAEAYLTGERGRPGVLFFVDAIGLRPQIEQMADRMASWGYTVLVPHVFHRSGPATALAPQADLREAGAREAFFAGLGGQMAALTTALSDADTDRWLAALAEAADGGPVGVTGYCMGARLAIRAAGRHPGRVVACGGFHGGHLVTDAADSPHRVIGHARAEFVLGHADQDPSLPPEAVEALETELAGTGRRYLNEIFAGAPHGYTMADTSMYDEGAAERHFTALEGLFGRTLGSAEA